jgi:hypothetical protein
MSIQVDFSAGTLTQHGKRRITQTLYDKGKSFVRAGAHLRSENGYEFVVLHLVCQGLEIVLKAFLLFKNYDKYVGKLKQFGHDISALAEACSEEYNLSIGSDEVLSQLNDLNNLYGHHNLRYGFGSALDFVVDPQTIQSDRLLFRFVAAIRLANHHLALTE